MREIRTERLLLRPLTEEDIDDIVDYSSHEDVSAHIPNYPHPYDHDHARDFVQRARKERESRERYEWAIEHEGRVIGSIGLSFKPYDTGEIGYALAKQHWGKGLATEALQAVVRYGFETEDLHRLQAKTFAENTASQNVLRKAGFRLEGRQRQSCYHRGERHDNLLWGLLRSDWEHKE